MGGDWRDALRLSAAAGGAWARGDLSRCEQVLQQQRRAGGADPRGELAAQITSTLLGALSGRLAPARVDLAAARSRMQSLGLAAFGPYWEQAALVCDWLTGEWVSAEARSARLEAMPPRPATISLGLRAELLRETGQRDAAERVLPRLSKESRSPFAAWARAGVDGRLDRLWALARRGRSGMLPWILHRVAETGWRRGEYDLARAAHASFAELDRDEPVSRVLAGLTHAYAVRRAEPAQTVQPIAEAEGAHALVAECLTVRGRFGADTLPAARDAWERIGARPRAIEIAAILGEPTPKRLTARERELVGLLQSGCDNRAIATTMHLSIKTVEAYLTRIYAKTGCSSRLELALAATQGSLALDDPGGE